MNLYKILTFRTLGAVMRGEPSYWRLSDPLRWPPGIRGSILVVMEPEYLNARISDTIHWCPLDSGGVRLGFQRAPDGVSADDLLLGAESLAELAALTARPAIDEAVRAGRPLWSVLADPLPHAPVLEAFRTAPSPGPPGPPGPPDPPEWTYEVFLGAAPPPAPAEIARIHCPNTAAAHVRDLMGLDRDDRIRTYNPRWGLDSVAVG